MIQETIGITGTILQKPPPSAAEKVENGRKDQKQGEDTLTTKQEDKVSAEELLSKIKDLTEEGLYGVRFEKDEKSNSLVVKVVDSKTGKLIRQVPSEELLNLHERLTEFDGNFIDTVT